MTNFLLIIICILLLVMIYSIDGLALEVRMVQTLLIQKLREDYKPKKRRAKKNNSDELQ